MLSLTRIQFVRPLARQQLLQGGISATRCTSENAALEKPSTSRQLAERNEVPIEKQSLTRGLALNKFEKDFLIFPEYAETEDVEKIKTFVKKIGSDFEHALVSTGKIGKEALPAQIIQVLVKNNIFETFVHKEFGGVGFCQKDLLLLSEALSKEDMSIFMIFNQAQSAAALISVYGTEEQKEKYLPRIAAFKCRPAVCVHDDSSADATGTHILKPPGQAALLNGLKVNVINADIADVYIVFAKQKVGDLIEKKCYIIDRENLGSGSIDVVERVQTQGLNAVHYSKVKFTDVPIQESYELGAIDSTEEMLNELILNSKTFYGAAVCGSLKKLIGQLCEFCNTRIDGNFRLSDTHAVQTALSELAVGVFVLESMVYYVGGMIDENLFLMNDCENTIIQRYANKVLRKAIVAICDIAGMAATNMDFEFEKMIRDIVTLISTTESDLKLVRKISLPTLETFIQKHGSLSTLMNRFTLTKMFTGERNFMDKFKDPKPSHFIAEHIHPSLANSAFALEKSMSRLHQVVDRLLTDKGIYIKDDYVSLKDLATVMENNLGMVAAISRTSRSYSIGLRNADDELSWTNFYCTIAAKETENILKETIDFFGLIQMNPKLTGVGQMVLENKGYAIEHPTERNW